MLRSIRATIQTPGFMLIEAAVVIAVMGIVGSLLTVFFQGAVNSYFSSVSRG